MYAFTGISMYATSENTRHYNKNPLVVQGCKPLQCTICSCVVQKEEKKTSHEFHEIVMNYFRSRKSLLSVEEDLKLLRQNYDQIQSEIWILHKRNITVEVSMFLHFAFTFCQWLVFELLLLLLLSLTAPRKYLRESEVEEKCVCANTNVTTHELSRSV